MKRIYDLTEAELLSLTDEDVMKYIDYECALDGVPMLPPAPGPMPTKTMLEPDANVFEVAGFLTMDSAHASRILDAFNSGILYKESCPGSDYNTKYLEPLTADKYGKPKIETKTVHSAEQWDKIKDSHQAFAGNKADWEKINKVYQEALKGRATISDDVWQQIRDARGHSYEREQIRAEYSRYLELAEGNRQIALNFLTKVKDLTEFPDLQAEFAPVPDAV